VKRKIKLKYNSFNKIELALFLLAFLLPIFFINAHSVKGVLGFNSEETRIKLHHEGKVLDFYTEAKTLNEALAGEGIIVYKEDWLSIPRDEALKGGLLEVYLKRALPVVIKDGERLIHLNTTARGDREVLSENQILHWPEDIISSSLIFDPIYYGGVGRLIKIERAPVFYIFVDGKGLEVRSWDGLVDGLVKKAGVSLNPNDTVSPKVNSRLTSGSEIRITRINYAEVTENEEIGFRTVFQDDHFLQLGRSTVAQKGVKGSAKITYRVTYKDGKEVDRARLSYLRISDPVNEVVRRGLMPSNRPHFKRNYWDIMVVAGLRYGVSPLDLFTVAACESRVNPNAVSRSINGKRYWGMFQLESTGDQFSGGLFSTNARCLGFDPNLWNSGEAQIHVTASIVSREGSWRRWGCKP